MILPQVATSGVVCRKRKLFDIVFDIMTRNQRARAHAAIQQMRRRLANVKRRELVELATLVGRRFSGGRGDEPTYEKPGRLPLSIPGHEGTMRSKWVTRNILNLLEEDIDADEEQER